MSSKVAQQRAGLRDVEWLGALEAIRSVDVVLLPMPGPGGTGRLPAARGRAFALRVEPLSKAQRLAPDGLPSLT